MKLDQLTPEFLMAAFIICIAVLIIGAITGGTIIFNIVKSLLGFFPAQQTPYPPTYYPDNSLLKNLVILALLLGAGYIIYYKLNGGLLKDITKKATDDLPEMKSKKASEMFPDVYPMDTVVKNVVKPEQSLKVSPPQKEKSDPQILQIGSFEDWGKARAKMRSLTNSGIRAGYFFTTGKSGQTMYSVFAGIFSSRSDAKDVRDNIREPESFILSASGLDLYYFEEDR